MVDDAARELDIPALARRYGRELASAAYEILESRQAAETAAAAGIADVLRARGATTLRDDEETSLALAVATRRRAEAAHRHWPEVDPQVEPIATAAPSFMVRPEAVVAALAGPRLGDHRGHRALALAAALLVLAAVGTGAWLASADVGQVAARPPVASLPPSQPPPAAGSDSADRSTSRGQITLAGCQIEPSSSPVSYRGWLTLGDLTTVSDPADASRPMFALVTAGEAEWLGWHGDGSGAMYPHPVGRVACALDPFAGTTRVFSVAGDWQPPRLVDACPPGDVHRYGDLREIGGPRLFAFLPIGGQSWRAGDRSLDLYLRLASPPRHMARVIATARSIETGVTLPLTVSRMGASPVTTPVRNLYVTLSNVGFPAAGCWIVSLRVAGEAAASTLLPVSGPA